MYDLNTSYNGPYTIKTSMDCNSYSFEVGCHIVVDDSSVANEGRKISLKIKENAATTESKHK